MVRTKRKGDWREVASPLFISFIFLFFFFRFKKATTDRH